MDLNKSFNLKFSLKESGLENSKPALIVIVFSVLVSLYLIHSIVNIYFDYDAYNTSQNHLQAIEQEKKTAEHNFQEIVKNNVDYFADLKNSPRSRSELANALTKLISDSGLKLIRLSSNDNIQQKKDSLFELEASGTYANIDRFTRVLHKTIGASELQSLKLVKQKEDGFLHMTITLKFSVAPNLKLPEAKQKKETVGFREPPFSEDWKIIRVAFVPADEKNVTQTEAVSTSVNKDPFQSPVANSPIANDAKKDLPPDLKAVEHKLSGYYLSGIFFSKHHRYCVIVLPSGESKVFTEGEKISPKLLIEKIARNFVVTNNRKSIPTHVGEELLP
jgi:hypothetical protein